MIVIEPILTILLDMDTSFRGREREREKYRQTYRQTDKYKDRDTGRKIRREKEITIKYLHDLNNYCNITNNITRFVLPARVHKHINK